MEKLTGYKKKMAMLGLKMLEEEKNNQITSTVEREKPLENKISSTEFR